MWRVYSLIWQIIQGEQEEKFVSRKELDYPSFSLVVRCAICDLHVSCGAMHVTGLCDGSYSVPRHLAIVPGGGLEEILYNAIGA